MGILFFSPVYALKTFTLKGLYVVQLLHAFAFDSGFICIYVGSFGNNNKGEKNKLFKETR